MVEKNSILLKYFREGKSKSLISRELNLSRQIVRKYIKEQEDKFLFSNRDISLTSNLSSKPKYDTSTRKRLKLNQEVLSEIENCLQENKKKSNCGMHKQKMKKIDIHQHLLSKGFEIGYSSVCNHIRAIELLGKECFIKQIYEPGVSTEFDWGEVKLFIDGRFQKFNMAVFTSCYSNHRWAKLFNRQDTLAFGQSHIDYISSIQGVYKEFIYDNMRVAIKKFVGKTQKEPTEKLLELSNYYKFGFRFCNARKGNEKGHVERSVEYIRRKSFCLKDKFISLKEANIHLLEWCVKLNNTSQKLKGNSTANELFKEEIPNLYNSKYPYKCFKKEYAKVDKYSCIILYGNRYSVEDYLIGKLLDINVFAEKIDIYFNSEFVCTHPRDYGLHKWIIDINHYLSTF